jgi:lipopolysaccharide biosynthesis glycosyltransferase/glycosyltransferase involved in cell wall biosynthesis/acetyltransferase-like isoleucine patch superfamily enzyme
MDNKVIIFDENQNEEIVSQIKGLTVTFRGKNNVVKIEKGSVFYSSHIILQNNCQVNIKKTNPYGIRNLSAELADNCSIKIGKDFSSVSIRFSMSQEKNLNVIIGDYCMCATNIILRPTDGHAIYDIENKKLLNKGEDIIIGDHVWLGLNCLILKGAYVSDNTVVGANSLINKKFTEENVIIAGSPAKIIKRNVNWDRKNPLVYEDEKSKENFSLVKRKVSNLIKRDVNRDRKSLNGDRKRRSGDGNPVMYDDENSVKNSSLVNDNISSVNEDTSKLSIVFISDDNYATCTAVAINSLYINRDKNNSYEIFIISHKISSINRGKLEKLSKENFDVKIIDIQDTKEYSSVKRHREHVSTTAMFKFDIPNILKSHDKVLYIDSDVLILQDLKDLFDMDFEDSYAIVVKDILTIKNKKHLKRLNFKCDFYFNSGVMLLNLKKLRQDDISDKLIDYRKNKTNHFMDQDAFNVVFCNKVKFAPLRYNLLNFYFEVLPVETLENFYDEKLNPEITENYKNATILHLGGAEKPWNMWMGYLSSIYLKYSFEFSYRLYFNILIRLIRNLNVKSRFDGISSFVYVAKKEKLNPKRIYRTFKARGLINSSDLFDERYYLSEHSDVRNSSMNPLDHYIYHGWKEKRIPSLKFDGNYYLRRYPDVRKSNVNPLVHYVLHGKKEGRFPNYHAEINLPQKINTYENFLSYLAELDKLNTEATIRPFLNRFQMGLKSAVDNGELDYSSFSMDELEVVQQIIKDPYAFYIENYVGEENYEEYLADWYFTKTGKTLDLKNPVTYNEKIQWLKLYDNPPIKTQLTDKYLVRGWIKERIGEEYLIPLLGVYDNFDEIDFDELPDKFIIKANHGSAMNIIVENKEELDMDHARDEVNSWLGKNYAYHWGLELHYKDIEPKIIIEEFIGEEGQDLEDYKILCFDGKPEIVWVDFDRYHGHKRNVYDLEHNLLPVKILHPLKMKDSNFKDEKPTTWDKMIELSEILSQGFNFVRVDFYSVDDKIYFGEMTFTSASGVEPILPEEFDRKLGDLIKLPGIPELTGDSAKQADVSNVTGNSVKLSDTLDVTGDSLSDMPKVSIVIPVYNVEDYLEDCLDSVINQTLEDIEIICVNDGSTDVSLSILEEYAGKDKRIKVISKPNSGYGHTMNVGMDAATGEYIGIVEPDDYVKLNMYEILYYEAKINDVDFIKADSCRFEGTGEETKFYRRNLTNNRSYYNRLVNPQEDLEPFKFMMNTWSGIYKRDFIEKYDIRHNETPGAAYQDNGFWFQTFCRATKTYFLNKALYIKRLDNPNSSVNDKGKVFAMSAEYDFIRDFLEDNPELKEKFIYIYQFKRFHSYRYNLDRVGMEFKKVFLEKFHEDFVLAEKNNELDKKLFWDNHWDYLQLIIKNPSKIYELYYKSGSGQRKSSFAYIFMKENLNPRNIYRIYKAKGQIKSLDLFDEEYYLSKYPDVKYSNMDPLDHYIYHGWREKRIPSTKFDGNYYLRRYPDVKRSNVNPLVHYVLHGKKEGRFPDQKAEIDSSSNK